jgi:probable phosphoglycerate mutase
MSGPKVLYVLRHGQTEWNLAGRMQGRLDSPLTSLGKAQASAHGELLKKLGGVDEIWVSSAGRAKATSELVNQHLSVPLRFSDHLLERDCGSWAGKTLDEVEQSEPENWSLRIDNPYYHRPGGGENMPDLRDRFRKLLEEFGWAESQAIIAHGVVSKTILEFFLGLNEAQTIAVKHPNSLLYRLILDSDGVEVSHFLAQDNGKVDSPSLHHSAVANLGVLGHSGVDESQWAVSASRQTE